MQILHTNSIGINRSGESQPYLRPPPIFSVSNCIPGELTGFLLEEAIRALGSLRSAPALRRQGGGGETAGAWQQRARIASSSRNPVSSPGIQLETENMGGGRR
ncbi:hypothetical protein EON65_41520 [archaeon]|nr:MAG: hypothetical protein EON65_41520 [archaeon]